MNKRICRQLLSKVSSFLPVLPMLQGAQCYTSYDSLIVSSDVACGWCPGTALLQIASWGVPLERLVLGKSMQPWDSGDGWVNATDLHGWLLTANDTSGYNGDTVVWQWDPAAGPQWAAMV